MATATKPAPKKRPRQKHLPGMAPTKNKELENLALRFVEAREAWQELKTPMLNARGLLEAKMKQLRLDRYEFDGNEIVFEKEEHIVVRRKKKGKGSSDEE
jgi:hypothetical protein